ncbi:MarR family transcriptional regulator [Bombilactobacillus folatiphilus]|uniref:MarR family transcriptional regulator n=1 Tax=Bombilactobacillus folatiphilus TaxID=2923362 RepID=A0ABY4P867_9LACO|nr:MarR family transcriptional regulator [Bombilactobacillus folatiphilus]UQS81802.1 MarR family transcriptional regulator [Bombilactobacillus folatiphilus]
MMMTDNFYPGDLAQYFSVIHRAFLHETHASYQKLHLNATSAYILVLLCKTGPQNQNFIAKTLLISKGQITREIRHLKAMSYVTQQVSDQNHAHNIISLTPQGCQILSQVELIRNQWWQDRLDFNQVNDDSLFEPTLRKIAQELIQRSKKES